MLRLSVSEGGTRAVACLHGVKRNSVDTEVSNEDSDFVGPEGLWGR